MKPALPKNVLLEEVGIVVAQVVGEVNLLVMVTVVAIRLRPHLKYQ